MDSAEIGLLILSTKAIFIGGGAPNWMVNFCENELGSGRRRDHI